MFPANRSPGGMSSARRRLLPLFAAAAWALASSGTALAQTAGKAWRIGVAQIVSHPALDMVAQGFEAGLAESGFREGQNLVYERYNADGDPKRAGEIAQSLARGRLDLIHAISTPTAQSVLKTASKTPLVFSAVTDPVAAGLVPSSSAPGNKSGTHVTGVSDRWPVALQFRLYASIVPQARTWGTIYNPAEVNSVSHVREMREAAQSLGFDLHEAHVSKAEDVAAAARSLVGKVQAIAITADNTSVSNFTAIAEVCNEHDIALFAGDIDSVSAGAVAAYGMDYFLIGYAAGKKAALVLRGISPGEIPWGVMEKFSLAINLRAAALQNVSISPEILRKADKVID